MENKKGENGLRILYIGAHKGGECEFMAGGSALVFKEKGADINFLYVFGKDYPTSEEDFFLGRETSFSGKVTSTFDIKFDMLDFNVNTLEALYQGKEISEAIFTKIVEYNPSIVFIQPPQDYLIDHVALAKYSFNAVMAVHREHPELEMREVYAMECPTWPYPRVDFYIDISDKMALLEKAFLSAGDNTKYARGLIKLKKGLAMIRGEQAGRTEYAEGFREVLRARDYDSSPFEIVKQLAGDRFKINPRASETYQAAYPL